MQVTTGERRRLRKAVERRLAATHDERTDNAPGEWLRLRAWVAWRLVLARGLGRSGRRIIHGRGRDQLREQLLEAATGRQEEFSRAHEDFAALYGPDEGPLGDDGYALAVGLRSTVASAGTPGSDGIVP